MKERIPYIEIGNGFHMPGQPRAQCPHANIQHQYIEDGLEVVRCFDCGCTLKQDLTPQATVVK